MCLSHSLSYLYLLVSFSSCLTLRLFVSLSVSPSTCLSHPPLVFFNVSPSACFVFLLVSPSVCLSSCLILCLFVSLSVLPSCCLSLFLSYPPAVCLSFCLILHLSVSSSYLILHLSVLLSVSSSACLSLLLSHPLPVCFSAGQEQSQALVSVQSNNAGGMLWICGSLLWLQQRSALHPHQTEQGMLTSDPVWVWKLMKAPHFRAAKEMTFVWTSMKTQRTGAADSSFTHCCCRHCLWTHKD